MDKDVVLLIQSVDSRSSLCLNHRVPMGFDKVYMCCCREVQAAEISGEYSARLAVFPYPTDPLPVESSITLRLGSD